MAGVFCWDQVLHLAQGEIKSLFKNKDVTLRFVGGLYVLPSATLCLQAYENKNKCMRKREEGQNIKCQK